MTSNGENDKHSDELESQKLDSEQGKAAQDLTSSMSTNDDSNPSSSQTSPKKQANKTSNPITPTSSTNKSRNRRRKETKAGRNAHLNRKSNINDTNGAQSERSAKSNSPPTLLREEELTATPKTAQSPTHQPIQASESVSTKHESTGGNNNKGPNDTNSWRRKQNELNRERVKHDKELRERDNQLRNISEKYKFQAMKILELESTLSSVTKTCNQFEKLLQQELTNRTRLEAENDGLNQTVARLKAQLAAYEKNKFQNDELIRVLNATLMERETEVSILKLKMTRMQTNPSSNVALGSTSSISSNKQDPCKAYTTSGRSNSEFCRNSYIRSSMIAEAASTRASTTLLRSPEKDASVWATVPEELTPSKRPQVLEKNLQPLYGSNHFSIYDRIPSPTKRMNSLSRNHKTLPTLTKSSTGKGEPDSVYSHPTSTPKFDSVQPIQPSYRVTNLDDTSSTSKTLDSSRTDDSQHSSPNSSRVVQNQQPPSEELISTNPTKRDLSSTAIKEAHATKSQEVDDTSHYSTISSSNIDFIKDVRQNVSKQDPPNLPARTPSTPIRSGLKKIFEKFKLSDSNASSQSKTDLAITSTPQSSPFRRGANRSTMVATTSDLRSQFSPRRQMSIQTDKPFAEWDTDMLVDWLTLIGLSMYTTNCRRWVRCGAHIMNATPAEVDKGLGITNHLHRKKLRLAISELNGDCDKVTKAAAKLDYLWVARWLDDIGLPQYKEAFINARVDGRVLNYLTVEDLVCMNVKSVLHHASIRCGIRVLRSVNFDLQMLKRRATAEEAEQMNNMRQKMNQVTNASMLCQASDDNVADVSTWTCHRVMEWLRMIDFAEFAPNLRGSGVHGGLIILEDGFNIETMCTLLSIPSSRTLLRRHLSTFFESLVGKTLTQRKNQAKDMPSSQQLFPSAEIKTSKKSPWFSKLKSSKVAQDGMDEYLCPMYPVEPQLLKTPSRKSEGISSREVSQLSKIPESINV